MPVSDTRHDTQGVCPCCGTVTGVATGTVTIEDSIESLYVVRWAQGNKSHNMAFLIGIPGMGGFASVLYSFEHASFMVVDPEDYDWSIDKEEDTRVLMRKEIIGTPWAPLLFAVLDEIWLLDPAVLAFHSSE